MIEPDETGRRERTAAGAAVPATEDEPTVSLAARDLETPPEPRTEPVPLTEPVPEQWTEPVPEPPTEPVVEQWAEPVLEQWTEPVPPTEPVLEQWTEPVPVPRAKPVPEPLTEPVPEWEPTAASVSGRDASGVPSLLSEEPDATGSVGDPETAGVPRSGDRKDGSAETSATSPDSAAPGESDLDRAKRRWPAPAGALIWVLLALFGFTLVVQLRSNAADDGLAGMRQEDLVRILSDLEAQDSRLLAEIQELETSKQQLSSGVAGRQAAQLEAAKRSQELGLLAGTEPGTGPGLDITLRDVRASDVLNTVQELRGAGGEVMQLNGANGGAVRVVASSFFVEASGGGIIADGEQLTGPFRLLVIGPPSTMSTALQIPGGVVASVQNDGGSVTMDSRSLVEVTAVRKAAALRYARPVS
ncbi:DUF881 domain-containing protein [Actinoplanes sp. NPDC049802]|uniref:DUF881 domain-containing protein n=1 Tax=Actinoplanes sp. NPDC049802 TaxID=3154742 RepID=UPI0033CD708A